MLKPNMGRLFTPPLALLGESSIYVAISFKIGLFALADGSFAALQIRIEIGVLHTLKPSRLRMGRHHR
jgi:hypothetical protein